MTDWQPIDTAPRDSTEILVWTPRAYQGKGGHLLALWIDGKRWRCVPSAWECHSTHWMPLPAGPAPKEAT